MAAEEGGEVAGEAEGERERGEEEAVSKERARRGGLPWAGVTAREGEDKEGMREEEEEEGGALLELLEVPLLRIERRATGFLGEEETEEGEEWEWIRGEEEEVNSVEGEEERGVAERGLGEGILLLGEGRAKEEEEEEEVIEGEREGEWEGEWEGEEVERGRGAGRGRLGGDTPFVFFSYLSNFILSSFFFFFF